MNNRVTKEELEKFYNAHLAGGDGLNLLLLNL